MNFQHFEYLENCKIYLEYISTLEKNKEETTLIKEKFITLFNYSCNLMKEIEIQKKLSGIKIMDKLIESEQ